MRTFVFVLLYGAVALADRGGSAVVEVAPKDFSWTGTGFYLQYNNTQYLITNKHVCSGEPKLYKFDLPLRVYTVIAESANWDLCVLSSDDTVEEPFELELSVSQGMPVTVCGYPHGLRRELPGIISRGGPAFIGSVSPPSKCKPPKVVRGNRCDSLEVVIGIRATGIAPGSSGSPVFIRPKKVVGVISGVGKGEADMIPSALLLNFMKEVVNEKESSSRVTDSGGYCG